MSLDKTVMQYLKPTDQQLDQMQAVREAGDDYLRHIEEHVPDGPDKTYAVRKLREVAMWANVAITRHADGSPRVDAR